jgi:hypothetical protein
MGTTTQQKKRWVTSRYQQLVQSPMFPAFHLKVYNAVVM